MAIDTVWAEILGQLSTKVSRPNYNTWLKSTELLEDRAGQAVIGVGSLYAKNWLEHHLLKDIKQLLRAHYPDLQEIRFVIKEAAPATTDLPLLQNQPEPAVDEAQAKEPDTPMPFNPKYSFDNFIVGNNNRLAFAAAEVVADKPGEVYNPLFIYGGVGLGKTHLMQAVGNEIWRRHPKKKIIYTSCETFTNEFIQALQTKTINDFKKKYRSVDVFLVDDIQFISNKEGTQEEFFHTFNMLHQANHQIIITSDRVPREIPDLEERLTSRFGWGMIADIQTPNFETRVAILKAKADQIKLTVDQDILEYIATNITSNVRELEGSLTRLAAAAKNNPGPIDINFTSQALKDLVHSSPAKLTSKKVIQVVAQHFDLPITDLIGPKRVKELVYPRQLTMYLLREVVRLPQAQIGEALGGRDHTTVMHGVSKISKQLKSDPATEADLHAIEQLLYGS